MHRIYADNQNLSSTQIIITNPDEVHHLSHVLRAKKNDTVSVFNDKGEEAVGRLTDIKKDCLAIAIQTFKPAPIEETQQPRIIMACAIPKKTKFEWIIEKATELGVDEIIPLDTARTEFHYGKDKVDKKHQRYQTVVINAVKQSKRRKPPTVHAVTPFKKALEQIDEDTLTLIPCLFGERKNLAEIIASNKKTKILFLIGPEGDFTDTEVIMAIDKGAVPITLGNTVLKVETAAIAVLSYLKFMM